jgi:hypothetical protein
MFRCFETARKPASPTERAWKYAIHCSWIAEWAVESSPEMREKLVDEGRLEEARSSLRHVLALRRLVLSAEEDKRIDACGDLDTLRRWHDQAIVVASAAEALQ